MRLERDGTESPEFPRPVSRTLDLDGPVHVADYGGPGPNDGPLLVAVHGLGGSYLNWLAVAPLLTGRSRLLAVDLVGHGRTPAAGRSADIDGHRRLLAGVLRAVCDEPVVLVGNSMGGLVTALQSAADPEGVAGLVLIDPALPVLGRPGIVHPRVVANFLICAVPGLGERFLDALRRRTPARQHVERVLRICCANPSRVAPEVVDALVDLTASLDRRECDAAYLRSARSLTALLARPSASARALDDIDCPVLLLHGERDWLVPLAVARRACASRRHWQLDVARGVGHVPMLEAPEWTASAIDRWLPAIRAEGAGAGAGAGVS
jgi:pimeloyl-ACP methyl ester carboxylesterase